MQLVHQPLSDGGNAKGRNEERKDEEHDPAHRLSADEQDQGEQRQHNAAQLAHSGRTEVSDLLERSGVHPDVRFTTWEDFAIMAMAERGLGVGILPDIILRRIPYKLEIRPLSIPYYRSIGLAVKDQAHLTPAVTKFIEYLPFREEAQPTLL